MSEYLYHYTTAASMEQIETSLSVKPTLRTIAGKTLSQGVYFSELPPMTPRSQLLLCNWGIRDSGTEGRYVCKCLRLTRDQLPQDKLQRMELYGGVGYFHLGPLQLKGIAFHIMDVDAVTSEDCESRVWYPVVPRV